MKQIVKAYSRDYVWDVKDGIQDYLDKHPTHHVYTIAMVRHNSVIEAIVVYEVEE